VCYDLLLCETFLILTRIRRDVTHLHSLHLNSNEILMKVEFFVTVSKYFQISNFVKIRPLGPEFHADRHDETNSRFSQFVNN